MEQIKRLIEAVDGLRSISVMAINQLSKTEESVIHALAAALPELRELVERQPFRRGDDLRLGDVFADDGRLGGGSIWLATGELSDVFQCRVLAPNDGLRFDGSPLAPGHIRYIVPRKTLTILATGVPLDATRWPMEESNG